MNRMFMKLWKSGFWLIPLFLLAWPVEAGYRGTLNRWTKSKQWYSTQTFQANIIWHATYFSSEFRRAFAERHVKKKFMDPLEAARYIADQEEKQNETHEFFIGLYARKPYREVTLSPASFWEVVLVTEKGEEIRPTTIEMVEIGPYEQVMFPYVDRWTRGYQIIFPKVELGSSFKLTLRSVIGASTVKWD